MKREKTPKPNKPESKAKKWIIISAVLIAVIAAVNFIAYPLYMYFANGLNIYFPDYSPEIVKESEYVDYDEDTGITFVNNELIVMTVEGTTLTQAEALAREFNAVIITAMEDIGFWQIRFNYSMDSEELNRLMRDMRRHEIVENVYLNQLAEMEVSTFEGEIEYKEPYFPNDPWGGDSWNMDAPRDRNWGVEAIRAPAAWGYRNELSDVKIGLIDSPPNRSHNDLDFERVLISSLSLSGSSNSAYDNIVITPRDNHGTHVAGTMAASFGNNEGISGVMGDKAILYYAQSYTITENGSVQTHFLNDWIMSFRALINDNVKVINLSMGYADGAMIYGASRGNTNAVNTIRTQSEIMANVLRRLIISGKEFVICAAAGNSNNNTFYKDDKAPFGYKTKYFWLWEAFSGEKGDAEALYASSLAHINDEFVKSRIIVVGSVKIDNKKSNSSETRYSFSAFSQIGARVDVSAPGEEIYSATREGYGFLSGTSMATPHVSGVAGLIFAANPDLTGAEVKRIILASTYGRFYYTGGFSGMIDAEAAVMFAFQTRSNSVNRVINTGISDGIDLCFVVDTTSSMRPYIDNAKENMKSILGVLEDKSENYRVAIVDYRDFPGRGGRQDYPSKLQLDFSTDNDAIIAVINSLTLGNGGDTPETVYSGLMEAIALDWRTNAQKAIIVLGDAPPLDPEPNTGYTFDSVLASLYEADIKIDFDFSDTRVFGDTESLIKVYPIGTNADGAAKSFFQNIADETGGMFTDISLASEVSGAIMDSIEQIEITPTNNVTASFGENYSGETVEIFMGGQFEFEIVLDENGDFYLERMDLDRYGFTMPRLMTNGTLRINETGRQARIIFDESPWYSFAVVLWQRERPAVIAGGIGAVLLLIIGGVVYVKIKKYRVKRKALLTEEHEQSETDNTNISADIESGSFSDDEIVTNSVETAEILPESEPETDDYISGTEEPPVTVEIYICPKCGAEFSKAINFCGKCGGKMV